MKTERNNSHCDFVTSHKQNIIDLLGRDEKDISYLFASHDSEALICKFATTLFDLFDSGSKSRWLSDVKKQMGKKFYYDVIEAYVCGNHST